MQNSFREDNIFYSLSDKFNVQNSDNIQLNDIVNLYPLIKTRYFDFEKEYRITLKLNNDESMYKDLIQVETKNDLEKKYIDIPFDLAAITGFTIPQIKNKDIKEKIEQLCDRYNLDWIKDNTISISRMPINYNYI